jgi:hypothetical protein
MVTQYPIESKSDLAKESKSRSLFGKSLVQNHCNELLKICQTEICRKYTAKTRRVNPAPIRKYFTEVEISIGSQFPEIEIDEGLCSDGTGVGGFLTGTPVPGRSSQ